MMFPKQQSPAAVTARPSISTLQEATMHTNPTESFDNPQVQQEHATYSLHGDVAHIRDLLAKCENPTALKESSVQIDEVINDLTQVRAWLDHRIADLSFVAPLLEVA
jgi:hypothetical protein